MKDCPFHSNSAGLVSCRRLCMSYYEVDGESHCKRLSGGGPPPIPVDIGLGGQTRFSIYCMSLTESEAWERLARILEAKLEHLLAVRDLDGGYA